MDLLFLLDLEFTSWDPFLTLYMFVAYLCQYDVDLLHLALALVHVRGGRRTSRRSDVSPRAWGLVAEEVSQNRSRCSDCYVPSEDLGRKGKDKVST